MVATMMNVNSQAGGPQTPARKGGRPRHQHIDSVILTAALDEFIENGVSGMTMQGVARRAGIARGSVSLRWRTVEDLLTAALETTAFGLKDPAGLPLGDAIELLVASWCQTLHDHRIRRVVVRLMAEQDKYPAVVDQFERLVAQPAVRQFDDYLTEALRREEVRPSIDVRVVRLAVMGAIWFEATPPSPDFKRALRDFVLQAVAP